MNVQLRNSVTRQEDRRGPPAHPRRRSSTPSPATLAAKQHLDVRFDLPDHPVVFIGDEGQLERVVLNLMSNAIKFSDDGGVVTCQVSTSGADVFLEVTDTGVGIPEEEQQELFTRFFRGASARDREIQGTGLGLHIVASIVANHGGNITVDSGAGIGTAFTVRLPRLVPD